MGSFYWCLLCYISERLRRPCSWSPIRRVFGFCRNCSQLGSSRRVLFGIQVSQQNSETNWRQYSSKQFGLSLAKNWILIFLPSYMTFHYLQTDAIDKWDSCLLAGMIHHTVCTRELCRVNHSHVPQPQELSAAIRNNKQILKLIFIICLAKLSMSAFEYLQFI